MEIVPCCTNLIGYENVNLLIFDSQSELTKKSTYYIYKDSFNNEF